MSNIVVVTVSDIPSQEIREILMGHLYILGFEGIEENTDNLKAYFNKETALLEETSDLLEKLKHEFGVRVDMEDLPDKNWNETWESNFQPIRVDDWVGVRASFHEPQKDVLHDIIIDPRMSFGTGHHATTWQMLALMQLISFNDKQVLDLGSGTAVLSILASFIGAKQIDAIDNDPLCYENASENCLENNVTNVKVILGGLDATTTKYDIILANINRNFLLDNMSQLSAKLKPRGYLFISGFFAHEAVMLLNKSLEHLLIAHYYTEKDNWAAIILHKRS